MLRQPHIPRGSGEALWMRRAVRVWDVGVVVATWTSFFPPARPRGVLGKPGGHPLEPPSEGACPL